MASPNEWQGVQIEARDRDGATALMMAAQNGYEDIADMLLQCGADPNAAIDRRSSRTHGGGRNRRVDEDDELGVGHLSVVSPRGSNSNGGGAPLPPGSTALHVAAAQGHAGMVDLLVHHNARIDAFDELGSTPLHEAAAQNHGQTAVVLLRLRADPAIETRDGLVAADVAAQEDADEVLRALCDAGYDFNSEPGRLGTPLEIAERTGARAAIAFLSKPLITRHQNDTVRQ